MIKPLFRKTRSIIYLALLMTLAFYLPASAENIKFGHVAPPFHGQVHSALGQP